MAFPGARKAILALLSHISSLVAFFQQTYFLLDLHNRHYYGLRQRLALTLASSKPIRALPHFLCCVMNIIITHHLRFSVNAANMVSYL